jgi:iron-sulfur cluster assembly accessory protein
MVDIIKVTEKAQDFIADVLKENPGTVFVVGYDGKGCSGHKYTFSLCLENEVPENVDGVYIKGGRVVIPPYSLVGLIGATLDLYENDFDTQLVWENPSAVGTCGCGDSFQLPGEGGCH